MTKPIHIYYHGGCPDGWASAWICYNAHKDKHDITLTPLQYGQEIPVLEEVGERFMLDFCPKSYAQLEQLSPIVIIDHHASAIEVLEDELPPGVFAFFDIERSGAGLTWDFFYPHQPRPWVVDYVEDRDLWRFELPHSKPVSAYIKSWDHSVGVWDKLSQQSVDEAARAGAGVLAQIDHYAKAACEHAYWAEMGDQIFPIVNIPHESCSDVCDLMLDVFDCDMAGYYFERADGMYQYGFRARNDVDLVPFVGEFGGGGHRYAAGTQSYTILHQRVTDD